MNCTSTGRVYRYVWRGAATLAVGVVLGACATTAATPTNALTEAREAIFIAQESGARQYARAELADAQNYLAMAETAVVEEEMATAERMADRARVTAELATARTEFAKATQINREMEQAAKALREEMQRTGDEE
ncbi:MAG: DUF4398 domain-containing protein [Halofilum sp. (in: g-proteobacteria)]|nr:DUF4398 domain-containing protein [Halofilum sp. (in: g-proteobacteria)]